MSAVITCSLTKYNVDDHVIEDDKVIVIKSKFASGDTLCTYCAKPTAEFMIYNGGFYDFICPKCIEQREWTSEPKLVHY